LAKAACFSDEIIDYAHRFGIEKHHKIRSAEGARDLRQFIAGRYLEDLKS